MERSSNNDRPTETSATSYCYSSQNEDINVVVSLDLAASSSVRPELHRSAVSVDSNQDDLDIDEDKEEDNDGEPSYDDGVFSPAFTMATAAATSIQYDVNDRTTAAPPHSKVKKRVWVLPRALLPASTLTSLSKPSRNVSSSAILPPAANVIAFPPSTSRIGEDVGATRTSMQSVSATAATAIGAGHSDSPSSFSFTPNNTGLQFSSASYSPSVGVRVSGGAAGGCGATNATGCQLPTQIVRLPHPRHGQPTLYLIRTDFSNSPLPSPSSSCFSSSLLYEVQAQAPSNDFAQTWFVGEEVIPSTPHGGELLVVTPVDLTYFALRELFADAAVYEKLSHKFMSPVDLYLNGERQASTHTPRTYPHYNRGQVNSERRDVLSTEEAQNHVSVFGRIGAGGADDHESSQSSNSLSYAFSFPNTHTTTTGGGSTQWCNAPHASTAVAHSSSTQLLSGDSGVIATPTRPYSSVVLSGQCKGTDWPGWANAAAQYPLLFLTCLTALQSDVVLRRLCDVREFDGDSVSTSSGGAVDVYYRPSEAVAVEWLKGKVLQLRASVTLRELLQLPERVEASKQPATSAPNSSQQEMSSPAAEVPMAIAFGMIAEYVPERLHAPLALACGLPDPSCASFSSAASPAFGAGVKRSREVDGANRGNGSAERKSSLAAETPVPTGPKSASVKRLEKAGRPKGTPTLFSMFAKKKENCE